MYAKIINNRVVAYPYGLPELQRDFPNTSFPTPMTNSEYLSYDVYPVTPRNPPSYNEVTQNCNRINPTLEGGAWVETWQVTPATAEEIKARTDQKADQVRSERNYKLSQSDWTQLPDAPVDHQVWATYRQQLRDITDQPGFPLNVIWPIPPQ